MAHFFVHIFMLITWILDFDQDFKEYMEAYFQNIRQLILLVYEYFLFLFKCSFIKRNFFLFSKMLVIETSQMIFWLLLFQIEMRRLSQSSFDRIVMQWGSGYLQGRQKWSGKRIQSYPIQKIIFSNRANTFFPHNKKFRMQFCNIYFSSKLLISQKIYPEFFYVINPNFLVSIFRSKYIKQILLWPDQLRVINKKIRKKVPLMQPEQKLQICTLPPRPKGQYSRERFRSVEIMSNFYRVRMKDIEEINIFKVKIIPFMAEDDRASRKKLIELALPTIKSHIPQPVISGLNIFSLRSPLDKQFKVQVDTRTIDIKLVKVINCKENPKMIIQFLNNGLRNLMSRINYVEIGRTSKYFNITKNQKIDNLMMFSGYKANFLELESGMFLRVDTAKKIVRNQTVLTAIKEIYLLHSAKDREQKRSIVKGELIDKIIMTNYGKTRYYRIADLQFEELEKVMIPGQNINIKEYYQKKYDIKIENSKQPLIVIEDRRKRETDDKTYLIPQLCLMTGIPDDFDQFRRKKISQATIRSADERLKQIQGLIDEIKHTSEINSLNEIGIKIDHKMEKFSAKLIPPPKLTLGNNQTVQKGRQAFFNLFAQPIFSSKHGIRAGLIYFKSTDSHQITELFEETSRKLQVKLELVKLNAGEFDSRKGLSTIDHYINKAAEQEACNICLIIIPNNMKSQYKKIKEKCLVHNKIICQIATQGTLRKKGFKSIATKILLQMIAKRGNTLWVPQSAQKLQKVMLLGFDNSKFGNKNLISGVATINSTYSSILSKYEQYLTAQDKYKGMVSVTIKLIEGYLHRNKTPPLEIVGFANSCSGDQISLYHKLFITPLQAQLNSRYDNSQPKFTFVLTNTKTNERFFQFDGHNVRNVPAGTIVSENIVSKNYDFFMVSQFANKGSTVPNHYRVISSDSRMEEGILQELIYSQCFNYVNWTGSIKVPGILQYAKKHVKFNTEVLEVKKISEELENKLYFI